MRETVNRKDLLKEMSSYKASLVINETIELFVQDDCPVYKTRKNIEIRSQNIDKSKINHKNVLKFDSNPHVLVCGQVGKGKHFISKAENVIVSP